MCSCRAQRLLRWQLQRRKQMEDGRGGKKDREGGSGEVSVYSFWGIIIRYREAIIGTTLTLIFE